MTPLEVAKFAADLAYPIGVVLLAVLVVLVAWLGPRFVRALEALPGATRVVADVVTAGRAEQAEQLRAIREGVEELLRRS